MEYNAGLMGPIIITAKGKAKPDGSPKDVDREFVTSFMIFDELHGQDAGPFHAINGYIFGKLPGLVMKKEEKVAPAPDGHGQHKDLHTRHWHGLTVSDPFATWTWWNCFPHHSLVDMVADNPGVWMFHCHVADHMEAGMTTPSPSTSRRPVRAAEIRLGKFLEHHEIWCGWKTPVERRSNNGPLPPSISWHRNICTVRLTPIGPRQAPSQPEPKDTGKDAYLEGGDSIPARRCSREKLLRGTAPPGFSSSAASAFKFIGATRTTQTCGYRLG